MKIKARSDVQDAVMTPFSSMTIYIQLSFGKSEIHAYFFNHQLIDGSCPCIQLTLINTLAGSWKSSCWFDHPGSELTSSLSLAYVLI